jgi:psiF repeat-containing protein
MRFSKTLMMTAFVVLIGSAGAIGQPATTAKPVAAQWGSTAEATGVTAKKAISKACSDQASAKGLHGKERKKFRSTCKRNGGKAA